VYWASVYWASVPARISRLAPDQVQAADRHRPLD
jgi:hypothetical protein